MKQAIIILHGWGITGSKYHLIKGMLDDAGYSVYTPDFPGFGKEKLRGKIMFLDDYVSFVVEYMQKNNIKNPILIGHSFGGRVAAKLAYLHPDLIKSIIITGSPLIRKKLSFKKQVISTIAQFYSKFLSFLPEGFNDRLRKLLYFSIKEWDYYKAKELKETLKAIIKEDLRFILPKISVPVLLVWGSEDTMVPVLDGEKISKLLPGSKFIVVSRTAHNLPYNNPREFFRSIKSFLS